MSTTGLEPIRRDPDFFLCNPLDVLPSFKSDVGSMEFPLFSLSTRAVHKTIEYRLNDNVFIKVIPSGLGLATIFDKDILIYAISRLMAAINRGDTPSKTIRFTTYDFLVTTNRDTGGSRYQRLKESLNRLMGTTINTNVTINGMFADEGFSLIQHWRVIKEDRHGKVIAGEITLSDWLYEAVLNTQVLNISPDYFRLRQPLARRLYELARKHCGDQPEWKIRVDNLKAKAGSTSNIREFRRLIRAVIEENILPDYSITSDGQVVTFKPKKPPSCLGRSGVSALKTDTYTKAKQVAPGYDVYGLESDWREWMQGRPAPNNPDAAFIGFCKKRHENNPNP